MDGRQGQTTMTDAAETSGATSGTAGSGIFGGTAARAFTEKLVAADRGAAGVLITDALRTVLEAGDDLDPAEAENGLVTVAVLVAEQEPSVLDSAPDAAALRERLTELDTELTPARRTAAQGVLVRVLVAQANSWLEQRSADADWPQVQAAIERLSELVADG